MSPLVVDKEQKEKHIMGSALNVFMRKGYMQTRMAEIAEEAGIGKGTIYEYFRSKEDIGIRLYRLTCDLSAKKIAEMTAVMRDPILRLQKYIEATLEINKRFADFKNFILGLWAEAVSSDHSGSEDTIRETLHGYLSDMGTILADGVGKGLFKYLDIDTTSMLLFGAIDGISTHAIYSLKEFDPGQLSWMIMRTFVGGMLTPEGERRLEDESPDSLR